MENENNNSTETITEFEQKSENTQEINQENQRPLINPKEESSLGPIFGIIIIVIILSIGALYYISYVKEEIELNTVKNTYQQEKSIDTETVEIETIEQEIKTESLDSIDQEIQEIESEIEKI